ncbi:MAG TPA: MlaD family protein [Thermoanaerobaculia bacterium]
MSNHRETRKKIRVGFFVAFSTLVLMIILFFIGSEQRLFSRKNDYKVRLVSVSGLAEGNPVQLSGVTIGVVRGITLPRDPTKRTVEITVQVEKKYAERIREDSRARLKKLGLIASDSYIDITPGSPNVPPIPPGSIIPAAKQTNVDELIASGEDLVDNFVQISYSLKNVLARVDRGEGLLGELTSSPEKKQKITDTLLATLNRTNAVLERVQSGRGLVGKLVYDDAYAEELTTTLNGSLKSIRSVMTSIEHGFESGEGAIPALLNDPTGRDKVFALVDNLSVTAQNLALFSETLRTGEGLVPRLMSDKAYADEALRELQLLVLRLSDTARKLNEGSGTAGRLITDPSVYEAINDILIGINESKLLRWLVRSRQQQGIETRYKAVTTAQPNPPAPEVKSNIAAPKEPPPPAVAPAVPPETTTQEPPTTSAGAPPVD